MSGLERLLGKFVRCRLAALVLFGFFGGLPAMLAGTGPAWPEIGQWFDQADEVVIGDVTAIKKLELTSPDNQQVTAVNVKCYKQSSAICEPQLVFKQHDPEGINSSGVNLRRGDKVLLFLRVNGNMREPINGYSVVEVNWVKYVSHGSTASSMPSKEGLQEDLASGLNSGNQLERLRTLECLRGFATLTPSVKTAVDSMPLDRSLSWDERLSALATLLLSETSTHQKYVSVAASIAQTYSSAIEQANPRLLFLVNSSLAGVAEKASLESLIEIFHSQLKPWHVGAMTAIRELKDPSTVPILIQGLDDSDYGVQYQAVAGLAEITGKSGDFGPGIGQFNQSPEVYVQLWKQWWETEGRMRSQK